MTTEIESQGHDAENTIVLFLQNGMCALVDRSDRWVLETGYRWTAMRVKRSHTFYVKGSKTENGIVTQVLLHRVILSPPADMTIDHENGNGLDCRRRNMRVVTQAKNSQNLPLSDRNTSGVKGVSWDRRRGKWRSYITINGKLTTLGRFDRREDAERVRKAAERDCYGVMVRNDN